MSQLITNTQNNFNTQAIMQTLLSEGYIAVSNHSSGEYIEARLPYNSSLNIRVSTQVTITGLKYSNCLIPSVSEARDWLSLGDQRRAV